MGRELDIQTAPVFRPLLEPARYKGAHGGRGSGKSQFFTDCTIEDALRWPGDVGEGLRQLEVREVQKSLKQSSKFLIEKKLAHYRLGEADGFKVYTDRIATPCDGTIEFQGMQDHTADTVKSYEGFHKARVEEAQTLSQFSLDLLRPTIRWENKPLGMASELAFSWNPRRKVDAVDKLLRGAILPTNALVVQANWRDNPWFPSVLEDERLDCLRDNPDQYDHIWEGGYVQAVEGAYYAKQLALARSQGRIGKVPRDPLMPLKAFWDIGFNDACTIWIVQFVGPRIHLIDYYEAQRQPLGAHLNWLRDNGYSAALCYLPHDGSKHDLIEGIRYEDHIRRAGFEVRTVPNQGKGAALKRVDAGRNAFGNMWFDADNCEAGLDALGWYHERRDEKRDTGLGPEHDWSSHAADSFGMIGVVWDGPIVKPAEKPRDRHRQRFYRSSAKSWLTA